MKTPEEILDQLVEKREEWHGRYTWPRSAIYEAIQLYSDQQNKELRDRLAQEDEKAIFIERANAEIQRLTKELDEVKTNHYQKLDAQLVEENERLTKEVERWKAEAIRWQKLYGNEKTNNA